MTREENIDLLVSKLKELGFHKTNMDIYLDGCWGMDTIPYHQRSRFGNDEMSWQLTIVMDKEAGLYYPQGYLATLLQTHPVPHAVFGKTNTEELEQRMKATDWHKYEHGTVVLDKKASGIIDDVFSLMGNPDKQAQDIARRLQLRYWLHTPVEQQWNVAQYAPGYERKHFFDLGDGLSDMHAKEAYNLLCGRSVLKFYMKENDQDNFYSHWKMMQGDTLATFPDFDIMTPLRALPLRELGDPSKGPQLVYDLIRGDKVVVHLNKDNIPMYLHVNAAEKCLQLYDDNWLLAEQRKQLADNEKRIDMPGRSMLKKRPGKNRGRSL